MPLSPLPDLENHPRQGPREGLYGGAMGKDGKFSGAPDQMAATDPDDLRIRFRHRF